MWLKQKGKVVRTKMRREREKCIHKLQTCAEPNCDCIFFVSPSSFFLREELLHRHCLRFCGHHNRDRPNKENKNC